MIFPYTERRFKAIFVRHLQADRHKSEIKKEIIVILSMKEGKGILKVHESGYGKYVMTRYSKV